jgi:hypothetical protein
VDHADVPGLVACLGRDAALEELAGDAPVFDIAEQTAAAVAAQLDADADADYDSDASDE